MNQGIVGIPSTEEASRNVLEWTRTLPGFLQQCLDSVYDVGLLMDMVGHKNMTEALVLERAIMVEKSSWVD